jgi:spoIIIJ-associated protein
VGDDPGKGFGTVAGWSVPTGNAGLDEQELDGVADEDLVDDEDIDEDIDDVDDVDDVDDEADEAEDDDDVDVDDEADDAEDDDEADEAEDDDADDEADFSSLEEEGEIAADYIEGLLDIADLDGDIDMDVEGDRAVVSVVGATLDELVGDDGEVLEALQELTRLAVHRRTGLRARLMLDVGGFRARRRSELAELGRSIAAEVSRTGEAKKLRAMSPFERKIIHDAVANAGLRSESEGEEPNRRVVVFPVG